MSNMSYIQLVFNVEKIYNFYGETIKEHIGISLRL